jgi:hypothetical protein
VAQRPRLLNPYWTELDPNGIPLCPRFVVQQEIATDAGEPGVRPFCLPDPEAEDTCGGFPNAGGVPAGKPACTDLAREERPVADVVHGFVCNAGRLFTRFAGHLNYLPAAYEGLLAYENHAWPDDDLDFELLPLEHVANAWRLRRTGTTSRRRVDEALVADAELKRRLREGGLDYCIHVEAKFEESVESFSQAWWAALRDAGNEERKRMMPFRPAVVTGLLGLDAEHGAFAELHPAYSLAVQTACGEADSSGGFVDTWAVFVRNSGNEGWCSQWDVPHFFDATGGVFTLAIPASLSGEMKAVEVLPSSELLANLPGVVRSPARLEDGRILIRFQWPSGLAVQQELRVHGELRLRWQPAPGAQPRCVDLAQAVAASVPDPLSVASAGVSEAAARAGGGVSETAAPASAEEFLRTLDVPVARMRAAGRPVDGEVVQEAAVDPPALPQWGPCPGNEPTCDPRLRPAVADRVAAPLVRSVRMRRDFEDRICAVAEERAARRPAGIDAKRLQELVTACRQRR